MTAISKEAFLSSFTRQIIPVDTPAGPVHIRNLTEDEYGALNRDALKNGKPNPAFNQLHRRRLVAAVLCDEEGRPWFKAGEADQLRQLGAGTVNAIYQAAVAHCGLGASEDPEKNLETTPDADLPAD